MKNRKATSIAGLYKSQIKMIFILIISVIISIFLLLFINQSKFYNDSALINVLGKQRMLTQMMAKDTGRIYELSSLASKDQDMETQNRISGELKNTMKELEQAKEEYDRQFSNIKNGFVIADNKKISFGKVLNELNPILKEQDDIWINFKKDIDIIKSYKYDSEEFIDASRYINENNNKLLSNSDEITQIILKRNIKTSENLSYIVMMLAVALLGFLIFFIRNAYKSLFLPISQINGIISNMAISSNGELKESLSESGQDFIFTEVKNIFNEFNYIIKIIENLNKNVPFKDNLNYIFDAFSGYIPYSYIGVALLDDSGKTIKASYGVSGKHHKNLGKKLVGFKYKLSNTSLQEVLLSGKVRIINDLEEYVKGKPVKPYNKILLQEGIKSSITFPLKSDDKPLGIIFFSSNTKNVYKNEHVRFLKILANSIMLSLEKDILMQDMVISSTLALAALTEERDPETGEHLSRMKAYSKVIAELLSKEKKYKDIIDIDYINNIERFSPLHDIGKVAIQDSILLKPGKLTPEEFEIMKTHATYGAKTLAMADDYIKKKGRSIFKIGIEIAGGHHEKWDGSGYPYGKSGEEIPLSARIVALADVFDALTSKRPYKEPFSFEQSTKIIAEGKGKHFDPYIIDVFFNNIDVIHGLYEKLNTENYEADL
ncbi:HD domain-containing phosphohydrolase [Clostridium omnivorum]|uniref:HD-GYP domain-containing protein n=1 Tax=Clostridium omnivorum TaxID=1604902 RepID=A0ABQ5N652_9CLOT|nr:HD domain-containing phosphohydrolase [Clostridium sp. E14]GLC30505.1 hypothetical protein bsdE14_19150 [Clostridium sp. E14]